MGFGCKGRNAYKSFRRASTILSVKCKFISTNWMQIFMSQTVRELIRIHGSGRTWNIILVSPFKAIVRLICPTSTYTLLWFMYLVTFINVLTNEYKIGALSYCLKVTFAVTQYLLSALPKHDDTVYTRNNELSIKQQHR